MLVVSLVTAWFLLPNNNFDIFLEYPSYDNSLINSFGGQNWYFFDMDIDENNASAFGVNIVEILHDGLRLPHAEVSMPN